METYTVGGRTFRVGELCLVRTWSVGYVAGVICRLPFGIPPRFVWVRWGTDPQPYPYDPERVLLLSENFSPGM